METNALPLSQAATNERVNALRY